MTTIHSSTDDDSTHTRFKTHFS